MNVYAKLNEARINLQNTPLKKSGQNKFAGYNYFELGDFLPTINSIFDRVGLCGVVSFTADLATLTIVDLQDASQIVITSPMGSAALKGCHEVQNIGAVETYQRRYLWVSAMEIVEHDALDATNGKEAPTPTPIKPAPLTEAQVKKHYDQWHQLKATLVYEDGVANNEAITDAWGSLPSNVRTAIKKYGESIKLVSEIDTANNQHLQSIKAA